MESLAATTTGVFWFFLPAGIANMVPVLFKWLPFASTPIDFNKKMGGLPVFGPHKTYRGFLVGIIFAIATVYLQKAITPGRSYWLVDYTNISAVSLGFLLGFGALAGDLIKSFFKRRIKIPSGYTWVPFDQIDWVVGALLLSSLIVDFKTSQVILALLIFGILHPIFNLIGYGLKIKPTKF